MRTISVLSLGLFLSIHWLALAVGDDEIKPEREIREQSIYIPYDKLQETFEKEGRGVFVPYERFQELWKAARETQTKQPEEAPPVRALITKIDSEAVVEADVVRVDATARIDLLSPGWLTIPLRLSDAAILSATIKGEAARLVPDRDGQALLLKKTTDDAEQIELKLQYAKGFAKAPGKNSVSFQAPIAPVNRWKIRIPDRGVKVNVHPMLAATEVPRDANSEATLATDIDPDAIAGEPDPKDETVVLAFVGAAPTVKIDWTPKSEGATGLDALVSVQTEQRIVIEEGITRTHTTLTYEVSRAELSQLRIQVPANQKVVNVLDANVRGWNVEADGDKQIINVQLFQPASQRQLLNVELEKFRDSENADTVVTAPVVQALGVGRQRGVLLVQVRSDLRAEAIRREGLSQLAADKQHESSYRYAALPFDLALKIEKVTPRIVVDQLVEVQLDPRTLTYTLSAKYDIQKAGVFELECTIPEGFEIRDVQGYACSGSTPAAVESYAVDAEAPTKLRINLSAKAEGQVGLLVELSRDLDSPNLLAPTGETEQLTFTPPRAAGIDVVRSTGRLVVSAPESLRLTVGELSGLRSISFAEAYKPIPASASTTKQSTVGLRPALAYEFAGENIAADVTAERRQPQVTSTQLLVARIDPGVVKYEATFDFEVKYSGVESIRIDLPEDIAAKFRNETRSLREQPLDPAPDDLQNGYTAVAFIGDTELLGKAQLKLTWEEAIQNLDVGKSIDLSVPVLVPQNVARSDGQVVLVKAETIDVRPKSVAEGLTPIDPQVDLAANANVPDAAAALEFRNTDWNLTLTATRYQLENLKHTSVEQGVLRMVVTRSDRVAVQALYRMRSNMQRLEIELPMDVADGEIEFDTEPLRINGRAVTLERGDSARTFFVPLVGYTTNDPLLLELRYTMPGNGNDLRYPIFPNEPAVQRVNLVAYLPQERDYIGSRGPWAAEMEWQTGDLFERRYIPKQDVSRLLANLQLGINVIGDPDRDFPVAGKPLLFTTLQPEHPDDGSLQLRTMERKLLDGIVMVGCLTIGVLLLTQSWITRLVVASGGLGGALLMGLFTPTLAGQVMDQSLLAAVMLVVLLWFVVALLQLARRWPAHRAALALSGGGTTSAENSESPPVEPASGVQQREEGDEHNG